MYRYSDVIQQVGLPSFATYNAGYLGGQFIGLVVAHTTGQPGIGAGVGIGIWAVGAVVSVVIGRTTTVSQLGAPGLFKRSSFLSRFYYVAFYSVRPKG